MLPCFDLSGKTALVTGGSQSIGKAIAKALALSGARISLVARTGDTLRVACEEIRALGADCIWSAADISDEAAVRAAVNGTVEAFGQLDILINNAAAPSVAKPVEELTLAQWRAVTRVNVDGMFIVAREAARHMIPRRSGKIVILCSIASEVFNNNCDPGVYEVSKGAVEAMVRVLSANWCKYNINVNGIAPGYFMSDVVRDFYSAHPDRLEKSAALVPVGRFAQPEELGAVGVLLSSDGASYMHGSIVTVDGGRTFM